MKTGSVSTSTLLALCPPLCWLSGPARAAAASEKNSCEDCHRNADFLVTNKKLYTYYQEWSTSVHRQEEVTCDDCHGGDPEASDEREAHGEGVGASDPASGVYYRNVPETCGTCHGSINSDVLDVNTVAAACARCHNEERDNHPEHPDKARAILNRFLSIQRFYRYITLRAQPGGAKAFFGKIDPQIRQLSVTWHTFDLEKIDAGTAELLSQLKAKREEIRGRQEGAK